MHFLKPKFLNHISIIHNTKIKFKKFYINTSFIQSTFHFLINLDIDELFLISNLSHYDKSVLFLTVLFYGFFVTQYMINFLYLWHILEKNIHICYYQATLFDIYP